MPTIWHDWINRSADYSLSKSMWLSGFLLISCTKAAVYLLSYCSPEGREGGTPYNGLYGETRPERGTFFRLEVYKRVGISRAEV